MTEPKQPTRRDIILIERALLELEGHALFRAEALRDFTVGKDDALHLTVKPNPDGQPVVSITVPQITGHTPSDCSMPFHVRTTLTPQISAILQGFIQAAAAEAEGIAQGARADRGRLLRGELTLEHHPGKGWVLPGSE
jgi:hypothetical protein